jgi:RNA polymerase sigma-70 factor, ECF subfamily
MPTKPPPDDLVLPRVVRGDPASIQACIDRFGGLVWSLARRLSRDNADAEDAVQEIFLDLWKSAGRFDPNVATEAAFVAVIARRRLIDRRRRSKRRLDVEPLPEGLEAHGEAAAVELSGEAVMARKALEKLRPEQLRVLLLGVLHGLSHDEIASATGMPLGTVKAHARRGLLKVRTLLLGQEQAQLEEEDA